MEKGENPSPQEKEVYEKVILTILDEIKKVKVEIFNHQLTIDITPVQGK